eukprot:gene8710-11769_t
MAAAMAIMLKTIILHFLTNRKEPKNKNHATLNSVEIGLKSSFYGDKLHNSWINITDHYNETWNIHYLYCSSYSLNNSTLDSQRKSKRKMLLVHGYGTSSTLAWRNVMSPFSKHYDVYAIDLPGFGRSIAPNSLFKHSVSPEDTINRYCHIFQEFILQVDIASPYVVAHSFGGFLFTHCISRIPHLIGKILIADVPGIFSTSGGHDLAWLTFFSAGLPQSLLRPFGELGYVLVKCLSKGLKLNIDDSVMSYWFELQTSQHLKSELIVSKFLNFASYFTGLEGLALVSLLNTSVPIIMLSGAMDSLAPPSHGEFLNEIVGIKHYIMPNTGHTPYLLSKANEFVKVVLDADQHTFKLIPEASSIASCLLRTNDQWNSFDKNPFNIIISKIKSILMDEKDYQSMIESPSIDYNRRVPVPVCNKWNSTLTKDIYFTSSKQR